MQPLITNDAQHAAALLDIERLWDSKIGTPDGDHLMEIVVAVVAYEETRWPWEPTDE